MAQPSSELPDVVFLSLARNCESTLPRFFDFLGDLRAHGMPCQALIGENGSTDRTRERIQQAPLPGVTWIDTAAMAAEPQRLLRMARGRQILLDTLRHEAHHPALVCVADLDNVMAVPPGADALRAAARQLSTDQSLFAIGASSRPFFYDLIALRAYGHDYSDLDEAIQSAKKKPLSYFRFHQQRIYAHQRRVTRELPLRCRSSFNGLCLYNTADYLLGDYVSPDGATTCEHVVLNERIAHRTGKQMLVSAELFVQAPADHIPVNFVRFWADRLRKAHRP